MKEEKSNVERFLIVFCAMVLVMSVFTVAAGAFMPDNFEGDIVLIEHAGTEEIQLMENMDLRILDTYGSNVLIEVEEETIPMLEQNGLRVNTLPGRTEISVKGHHIDITEGEPELESDLQIDGYGEGEEGMYLVHMLGPVNPEWRINLERVGVEIINYVPNYAYEVVMTPELADEVEDLFFVDWVGIYQPEYKLHSRLNEALDIDMPINVRLRPGYDIDSLIFLESDFEVISVEDLRENGMRIVLDIDSESELEDLAMMNDVYFISPYVEPELHAEMDIQLIGGGLWFMDDEYPTNEDLTPPPRQGDPQEPYRLHGDFGAYINQLGYSGEGSTVAVADTGIGDGTVGDAGVTDFTGRVIGGYGFGADETNWADGHYHGTACTGLVVGDTHSGTGAMWSDFEDGDMDYYMGQGLAYESEIFATKIFDDGGGFLGAPYYDIVEEPAQRSDAYIHSNSWGASTDGAYSESDEIFDQAVRDADRDTDENRPMVITTSAGNDGARGDTTTGSPSNSKNVITVGGNQPYNPGLGHENPEDMYGSSSRGWTEDNRIKPDVIAPSDNVLSHNTPLDEPDSYVSASGTSFGNPLVAGAATIVVDWYEENYGETPSPAMVKSILINTANDLDPEIGDSRGHIPNQDEGWGVPDLSKLEYPTEDPIGFMFEDQESLLTTGDVDEYEISYQDEDEPLKITLTWTDENALEGDSEEGTPTLKNNLDLEVETPSGEIIRGNAFDLSGDGVSDDGFTYPDAQVMSDFDYNGDGWDEVNNVQNVYINPEHVEDGVYRVRVRGTNIPSDANNDGYANQDYALTAFNVPLVAEDGIFRTDHHRYAEEDTIEFMVIDRDMQEQDTVDIEVTSFDQEGEIMDEIPDFTLRGDRSGTVMGSLDISPYFEDSDEGLYVEHGFEIEGVYYDQSMDEEKYVNAVVDGEPPAGVSDVEVEWSGEQDNRISWQLSEDDDWEYLDGYRIYRAESIDGEPDDWELIDSVLPGTDEYIDEGKGELDYNRYWYDVGAIDDVGNENITEDPAFESPTTRLDSPLSGEIWTSGNEEDIEWYAATGGVDAEITLEYSIDNGDNWTTIVEEFEVDQGEGSFTWLIPEVENNENESLIRVTIEDEYDESSTLSDPFVLSEYEPPSVEITSLEEGDTLYINTVEDIEWTTTLGDGNFLLVRLEYSLDDGDTWNLITEETEDNETYPWQTPMDQSDEVRVRVTIEDDNDLYAHHISERFEIIAALPPENLEVDYVSLEGEVQFHDTIEDGEAEEGYETDESLEGINEWAVRDHGAYEGDYSWDFGNADYQEVEGGGLSWLISPEVEIPEDSEGAQLSFQNWLDFDYRYDGGNVRISTDGETWDLIEPIHDYPYTISDEFDNPLAGEPAFAGTEDWDEVIFDIDEYVGETVRFNWSAGVDSWEANNEGWRLDDIRVTAFRPYEGEPYNSENRLLWDASPDDGAGEDNVVSYNVYRSESEDELGENIGNVDAEGLAEYRYIDEGAGTEDDITWWYNVRAVSDEDVEEEVGDSDREPEAPYPPKTPEPEYGSALPVGQHGAVELSSVLTHARSDTTMDVSFYDAETDELIGEVSDVDENERANAEWYLLSEGEHTWYVTVHDGDYLVTSEVWSFTVDATDPVVNLISPEEGEIFSENDLTVLWEGHDDVSGIDYYEIRVRNHLPWTDVGRQTSTVIENLPDGKQIVDLRVVDNAGNKDMDSVEFIVDTSNPVVEIIQPKTGDIFGEDRVEVEWNGYDEVTDIEEYNIRLNDQDWMSVGLSEAYTMTGLQEDENIIQVRATDLAGNNYTSSVTFIYDATSPPVEISSPYEGQVIDQDWIDVTWQGEATWDREDMITPIERYEIRMDDQGWIDYDYEEPREPIYGGGMIWQHNHHDQTVYSVFESDGVLYSASYDQTVLGYDIESGEVLWQHDYHDGSVRSVFESDGVVYSAGGTGIGTTHAVIAYDYEAGEVLWQHEHHDFNPNSVYVSDGVVYSASSGGLGQNGQVIASDAENGDMLWQHDHHESPVQDVVESGGVVYSGSSDETVIAYDYENEEILWQHEHHDGFVYDIHIYDGVVYSGSDDDTVVAVDLEDGELIWQHEHHEGAVNSVFESEGVLYSGSSDNTVIAYDYENEEIIWQNENHEGSVSSVVVSGEVVYSGSYDDSIIASRTEDEIIEIPVLSHNFTDLIDGEHTVYIRAIDKAGNRHTESVDFTVDTPEAELEIISPDGGVQNMMYDEEFIIEGQADLESTVYIDGDEVNTDDEGYFEHEETLIEGQNVFVVKAEHPYGDVTETTVYALYLPQIPELWDEIADVHDGLQNKIDDLEAQTEDLENQIDDLEAQTDDLESDIDTLETELLDEINDLQSQIDELENQMEELEIDLEEQIDALETELNSLENDLLSQTDTLRTQIDDFETEQEQRDEEQDDDISMARNLGIVGLILAILALIIGIVAITKKGSEPDEEEPVFEEEEFEEEVEEELFEEELFDEEEAEEELFDEEY